VAQSYCHKPLVIIKLCNTQPMESKITRMNNCLSPYKGKVVPVAKHHTRKTYGGVEIQLHTF